MTSIKQLMSDITTRKCCGEIVGEHGPTGITFARDRLGIEINTGHPEGVEYLNFHGTTPPLFGRVATSRAVARWMKECGY